MLNAGKVEGGMLQVVGAWHAPHAKVQGTDTERLWSRNNKGGVVTSGKGMKAAHTVVKQ